MHLLKWGCHSSLMTGNWPLGAGIHVSPGSPQTVNWMSLNISTAQKQVKFFFSTLT